MKLRDLGQDKNTRMDDCSIVGVDAVAPQNTVQISRGEIRSARGEDHSINKDGRPISVSLKGQSHKIFEGRTRS